AAVASRISMRSRLSGSPICRVRPAGMVNVVDQTGAVRQDAAVPDITRLLLEARRSLASELDADLGERGYPDLRPGHAALFLSVDRRSGSRLTDLAEHTRLTKQAMSA